MLFVNVKFMTEFEKAFQIWSIVEKKLSKQIDSYQEVFEENIFSNNKFTRKRGDTKGSALYLPGLIKAVVSDFTYTKIFSSKTAGGCKSYNIVIGLDISYSMDGHLKECAIESLVCFICALLRIGIENFALILFGKVVKLIKLQNQSWAKAVIHTLLTSLESDQENMTADADAIKASIEIFKSSLNNGPQRLFLFTDGFSSHPNKLKLILKETEALNIEVVAIAVGCDKFFVQKYYKSYICCALPSALHLAMNEFFENQEVLGNKDDNWDGLKQLLPTSDKNNVKNILKDFESNRVFKDLLEQLKFEKEAKLSSSRGGNNFGNVTIDLCFCIDCTGSMGVWLSEAKKQAHGIVENITKEIQEKYPSINLSFRYAALGYRDFNDNPKFEEFLFNENSTEFLKFVDGLKAFGGDDISEDVLGALDKVLNDSKWKDTWKSNAKFLILITDSPPHGRIFGDPQHDNYPDIDNAYEKTKLLMNRIKDRDIEFLMVPVNKQNLIKTESVFRSFYDSTEHNKKLEVVELHDSSSVQKFDLNHFIFLLDSSGSMSENNKWANLLAVFQEFLKIRRNDQGTNNYVSTLTHDHISTIHENTVLIKNCHGKLPFRMGGNDFLLALKTATPLITTTSNAVRPIMIFMSDGIADNPTEYVKNLYQRYHESRGFLLYTVAFGRDADFNILNQMAAAGGTKNFLQAVNANELLNAFETIATDCQKALNGIVSKFAEYLGSQIGQKIALDYL